MTTYVDTPTTYPDKAFGETNARTRMGLYAHLWADSTEELEAFAESAGIPTMWVKHKRGKTGLAFYYVTPGMQEVCLKRGAKLTTISQWVYEKGKRK